MRLVHPARRGPRHRHCIELWQAARRRLRATRRLQRERQAEDTDRAGRLCCAAGDARARGAAAGDERQPAELAGAQVLDDGRPGRVELVCRCRGTTPGDAVGLLDEHDAEPRRERASVTETRSRAVTPPAAP